MPLTLLRQHHPLAQSREQVRILEGDSVPLLPRFETVLDQHYITPLRAERIDVLQINVGKRCNQTCQHCHVDAGPERIEVMSRETAEACIAVLRQTEIATLDLTGGAPELNPNFRWLVQEARKLGRHVIDRCNLTILLAPGFDDLPQFLSEYHVEVIASLPCYLEENTDRQRGPGAFTKSVAALRRLNALGYGLANGSLPLNLVYNPLGIGLPPSQAGLEEAYRRELLVRYGIVFNQLFTITNMPISRFLEDLLRTGKYEEYMNKLIAAFNPQAAAGVMCRNLLSVDWQGNLYDCDFNQMLELGVAPPAPTNIRDFDFQRVVGRRIVTGRHCFGCTAGAGSSCGGALLT